MTESCHVQWTLPVKMEDSNGCHVINVFIVNIHTSQLSPKGVYITILQLLLVCFCFLQLPGGSVLLPNPNPMIPGTVYQYQPRLMGQYIPNMSTQVIQIPMSYMQPPAYRSPAPIPPPQQLLQKRERISIPIVDPNTKTVIVQVSTPH